MNNLSKDTLEIDNTTIRIDQAGRFSLNDVHSASRKHGIFTPELFLNKAKRNYKAPRENQYPYFPISTNHEHTFANSELTEQYAAWIDEDFYLEISQKIKSYEEKKYSEGLEAIQELEQILERSSPPYGFISMKELLFAMDTYGLSENTIKKLFTIEKVPFTFYSTPLKNGNLTLIKVWAAEKLQTIFDEFYSTSTKMSPSRFSHPKLPGTFKMTEPD